MLQESSSRTPLCHLTLQGCIDRLHDGPLLFDLLHELKDLVSLWFGLFILLTILERDVHRLRDELGRGRLVARLFVPV